MKTSPTQTPAAAWLVPLSGPPLQPIALVDSPDGLVLGRHEGCELRLPAEADNVSRRHARFVFASGHWRVEDLKSRWGTFVNGQALPPGRDMPLAEGDLIRITPWTFTFSADGAPGRGVESFDDSASAATFLRSVAPGQAAPLADDLLALLLESSATIHGAADPKALADMVIDAACRGTGFPNAAVVQPLDNAGRLAVLASRQAAGGEGAKFSRSLIAAASQGVVAEYSQDSGGDISQSIVQMKVTEAICVPLMMGATVAAYLYLDARGPREAAARQRKSGSDAAMAFCLALGRLAGLALANLKRVEMESRQASMMAELSAGAEAQRWILPRRRGSFPPFQYTGESRPGRHVGGDFFDVIPLDESRLVVSMGDVTGKGIPAAVLMTATQGFLHAAIKEHAQPVRAVNELNAFIHPRRPENRFVTLWVGLFDAAAGTVTFVDAGHGYALLWLPGGPLQMLNGEGGPPVGVAPDLLYESQTLPLPDRWGALVVSDGIIEQAAAAGSNAPGEGPRRQFGVEGVRNCLERSGGDADVVAALFQAVSAHAGGEPLADDASALWVTTQSK